MNNPEVSEYSFDEIERLKSFWYQKGYKEGLEKAIEIIQSSATGTITVLTLIKDDRYNIDKKLQLIGKNK